MVIKKIPFLLFIIYTTICYPCDCGAFKNIISPTKETQKTSRENSECILVGRINSIDIRNQIAEITVIESLDGSDLQDNTYLVKGWKYCSPYFKNDGVWLIYGYTEDGYLRPNICGISRSFDSFSKVNQNTTNKENSLDSWYLDLEKEFLESLYLEIKALRTYKFRRLSENISDI